MSGNKDKVKIIEPLWYVYHVSNITKRNDRAIWELMLPIFLSFIISYPILLYLTPDLTGSTAGIIVMTMILSFFVISYYGTRKYIVESDLDIDRYSWVAYYCGRIGLDLHRLGNMPEYNDNISLYNYGLQRWLRFVIWDYHGDKSGKRNLIKKLRRDLKNLSKFVKDNKNDPKKMFELGNRFLNLGENISEENPEIRINADYLNNLIGYIPESKPGIYDKALKFITSKYSIVVIFIIAGIVISLLSYYVMHFDIQNTITYFVLTITILFSLYSILIKEK